MDPLAELSRQWTPYNYCENNPMRFIDPVGRAANDTLRNGGQLPEVTVIAYQSPYCIFWSYSGSNPYMFSPETINAVVDDELNIALLFMPIPFADEAAAWVLKYFQKYVYLQNL